MQRKVDLAELTASQQSFKDEKQALALHNSHVYATVNGAVFKRLHYALMAHDDVKAILAALEERAANHKKEDNRKAIRGFIKAFSECKTNLSDLMKMPTLSPTLDKLTYGNVSVSLLSSAVKPTRTCLLLQQLQVTLNKLIDAWETLTPTKDLENDFQQRSVSLSNLGFLNNPPTVIKPTPGYLCSYHYEAFLVILNPVSTHRDKDLLKLELKSINDDPLKDDVTKLKEFRNKISDDYVAIEKTLGISYKIFGHGSNLGNALKKYLTVLDQVLAAHPTLQTITPNED